MYFVKRFGLVCMIAVDASSNIGEGKDGLRGRGATTIEPTGSDTTTPDLDGDVTGIDVLGTTQPLEFEDVDDYNDPFNPFTNRIGFPLHRAAWSGRLETAERLLVQGADVTEADIEGVTPLMAAVHSGNLELVALIVRRGVNVNQGDIVNGRTALIMALEYGSLDIANFLINNGADVNQARIDGYSPLMASA